MIGHIKDIEFLDFRLKSPSRTQSVVPKGSLRGDGQVSSAAGNFLRAILISFKAEEKKTGYLFQAECRVVFELDEAEQLAAGDVFFDENFNAACEKFYGMANDALTALGWNEFPFDQILQ